MKFTALLAVAVVAAVSAYAMHRMHADEPRLSTLWEHTVVPGELSLAHADLDHQCEACHTPFSGVARDQCVSCHANESALLARQPTAFHADIETCAGCHVEHRGHSASITTMNHGFLSSHGMDVLKRDDSAAYENVLHLVRMMRNTATPTSAHPDVPPDEAVLDCVSCHLNDDRHWGLFGTACVSCHEVESWSLAAFRHPPAQSTDCSQCHQAPPSHYMMHFKMISAKVAGKPHAPVDQCYQCHQTTSWNDIKRVGIYKHH